MNRHTPAFALLLLSLSLAWAGPALAAQWKWKDAQGRLQISDRPPPKSVPESSIISRPGGPPVGLRYGVAPEPGAGASQAAGSTPAAPPKAGAAASAAGALQPRDSAQEAREKADLKRAAAARAENCQRARAQIQLLNEGARVARVNERGEREILGDEGRSAELSRAQRIAQEDCR
jgi:hypothetical protein